MNTTTWFKHHLTNTSLVEKLKQISLIITDVDGCLTDGTITQQADGIKQKQFNVLDGLGIDIAHKAGIKVAFVSGDNTLVTRLRATRLGIPDNRCHLVPWREKPATITALQQQENVTPAQTLIFGDDISDLALKPQAGVFACPANALFYVAASAELQSPHTGSTGALRSIIDLLLYTQGTHPCQDTLSVLLRS